MIETLSQQPGEKSEGDDYALIISDMSMPRMNGQVFLQKAKLVSPDSIIFLLTGNQDFQTNVQAGSKFDGLIDKFLRKPCDPEILAETIEWGFEEYSRRKNTISSSVNQITGSLRN